MGVELIRRPLVPKGGKIVALNATALSLSRNHADRTVRMDHTAAASTVTLPPATGSGDRFRIVVGAVNANNHVVQVTGDDTMGGVIYAASTGDTPDLGQPWVTAADSDTVTLNGTTTGGAAIGDSVEFEDIAANKWRVLGFVTASGTEATPFSAAVA